MRDSSSTKLNVKIFFDFEKRLPAVIHIGCCCTVYQHFDDTRGINYCNVRRMKSKPWWMPSASEKNQMAITTNPITISAFYSITKLVVFCNSRTRQLIHGVLLWAYIIFFCFFICLYRKIYECANKTPVPWNWNSDNNNVLMKNVDLSLDSTTRSEEG